MGGERGGEYLDLHIPNEGKGVELHLNHFKT